MCHSRCVTRSESSNGIFVRNRQRFGGGCSVCRSSSSSTTTTSSSSSTGHIMGYSVPLLLHRSLVLVYNLLLALADVLIMWQYDDDDDDDDDVLIMWQCTCSMMMK
jgi:hypothetical protein